MYSYLIQRDLKTKEWLSKFELDNANRVSTDKKPTSTKKDTRAGTKQPKSVGKPESKNSGVAFSTKVTSLKVRADCKQQLLDKASSIAASAHPVKLVNEHANLRQCAEDSLRSIEYLEKQLSECEF
jgi:hypothetical protein